MAESSKDQRWQADALARPDSSPSGNGSAGVPESPDSTTFNPLDLRDRVVIKLLYEELVLIQHVQAAWDRWVKKEGGTSYPLWRELAEDPEIDPEIVFEQAAIVYSFATISLEGMDPTDFLKGLGARITADQWAGLEQLRVAPVKIEEGSEGRRVIMATHDPARQDLMRTLQKLGFREIEIRFAKRVEVDGFIDEVRRRRKGDFGKAAEGMLAFDLGASVDDPERALFDEDALEAEINRSALINLFEATLKEAVRQGASDVHIFPNARKEIEIRLRIDGELTSWHIEDRVHPEAFLAVVKDNSINVDRFERERAQDGFIQREIDNALIRFRVSVLPIANAEMTVRSESIVIRILDDRKVIKDLRKLGLAESALERFEWAIHQPYGMVILTGPTGSGKSTTLYAALSHVVTPKVNVLTVEDPVEYVIPEVRQVKLSHKLSLDQALRSILRHDPDIVMVGEMRDKDTADLAIKLANTGHLTFSTLHTNDAPSSISRLYKMGIEPFLIAYAINLVVAQRLIRTVCQDCKAPATSIEKSKLSHLGFRPEELDKITFYNATEGGKCKTCRGVGYKGRRAITETMPFTPEIREMIVEAEEAIDEAALGRLAIKQGMLTLQDSARAMVIAGETTIEEMSRVVFSGL
ncbi:MAG: type II/IV secretion system protein [Rhodothermales bacterium]|nr:type II/IV secretion system protein [Rhodothermales bacterium]